MRWLLISAIMGLCLGVCGCRPAATESDVINAVASGNTAQLEKLLRSGASANSRDKRGLTALSIACLNADVPVMRVLIEHGAYIRFRGTSNDPMSLAVESGDTAAVKLLLDHDASPNGDGFKPPPLGLATSHEMAETLLKGGADPNAPYGAGADRPLGMAVRRSQFEVSKLLIDAKADVNGINGDGQTPLHLACAARNSALIAGGKDPSLEMIKLLISHGADTNLQDERGNLPIHYLARNKLSKVEAAQALIDAGQRLSVRNLNELLPLDLAFSAGRNDDDPMVKLLRTASNDWAPRTDLAKPESNNRGGPLQKGKGPF